MYGFGESREVDESGEGGGTAASGEEIRYGITA
jgi:hypothetical protein